MVNVLPRIGAVVRAQHVATNNREALPKLVPEFALPLEREIGGGHDQNSLNQPADFQLLDKQAGHEVTTEASLRLKLNGERTLHNADGDGPVNALDEVLRRTLRKQFPELLHVRLNDYKVRIVDAFRGTAAKVRVRIEFTDGHKTWTTMAVHENIIEASWEALLDGYIYKLVVNGQKTAFAKTAKTASE